MAISQTLQRQDQGSSQVLTSLWYHLQPIQSAQAQHRQVIQAHLPTHGGAAQGTFTPFATESLFAKRQLLVPAPPAELSACRARAG